MPSRRAFLGTLGIASLTATSGCAALSDLADPLRSHVLHEEAPVGSLDGPWPTHAADPGRTGAVTGETAPPADATAQKLTHVGLYADAQPAVAGDRGFLGVDRREFDGADGEYEPGEFSGLVALDVAGSRPDEPVLWRASEGDGTTPFTPTVAGSVVYAPVGEGLKALDAATGRVYWRTTAGGLTPTVDGADCFTAQDRVVALDAATGETRWRSEATEHAASGLAVTDDAVYLACGDSHDGSLWAFDRGDGSTRWRYTDVGESYATAVAGDERVYAVSTSGILHAVGRSDGERRWIHRLGDGSYVQPAVADGTVYLAGTNTDRLVALDAASGEVEWDQPLGIGGCSPPTVTAEAVLVRSVTQEGDRLFVLDRADGTERARIDLPTGSGAAVQPVVADGVTYVVGEPSMETHSFLYAVA